MRCYKDVEKAMGQSWHRTRPFTIGVSVELQIAEELDSRLGIFMTLASTSPWWARPVSLGNVTGGLASGGIVSGQGYIGLTIRDYGGLVKGPWWAIQTVAGGTVIWVVECIGPKMDDSNSYEDSVSW